MNQFWDFFSFFITQAFIGYSLALGYFYIFSHKRQKDFFLIMVISFLGVFSGGLWEVFILRPAINTPEYFLGFQFLIPTVSGLMLLFLYGTVNRIKEF